MASSHLTGMVLVISVSLVFTTPGHAATPDSKLIPPRGPDGEPVQVKLDLELINVANLDPANNELDVYAWPTISWNDRRLAWDPRYRDNVTMIRMPVEDIWMPDLVPFNAVKKPEIASPNLVVVQSNGMAMYVPNTRMRIMCDLADVTSEEGANCSLKIGSWTYSGANLVLGENPSIGTSNFFEGSRYDILSVSAKRDEKKYDCCPEKYFDVKFMFTIRDKSRGAVAEREGGGSSSSEEVGENGDTMDRELEAAGEDRDLAKEIERLVRGQVKRNTKKATVLTRSKGFTKSFIWQG